MTKAIARGGATVGKQQGTAGQAGAAQPGARASATLTLAQWKTAVLAAGIGATFADDPAQINAQDIAVYQLDTQHGPFADQGTWVHTPRSAKGNPSGLVDATGTPVIGPEEYICEQFFSATHASLVNGTPKKYRDWMQACSESPLRA